MSRSDRRQVETEGRAGQVRERAREVVETLGLGDYGGDRDGRLEGVGEGDGGDKGGEEGAGEGGGVQEGGEDGHSCGDGTMVKNGQRVNLFTIVNARHRLQVYVPGNVYFMYIFGIGSIVGPL